MKTSLILTALILAAGSFWGWQEAKQLTVLREKQRHVREEAEALGISSDGSKADLRTKIAKRDRERNDLKIKQITDQFLAFSKKQKEFQKTGGHPTDDDQKIGLDLIENLTSLSGEELKELISQLKGRNDLEGEDKKNLITFAMMMLAQQHPEAALTIFTESSDLLKDSNSMNNHLLSMALTQWSRDQPLQALEWIKKNAEKYPELVNQQAKNSVVLGAAQKDISLAISLISELKLSDNSNELMSSIADLAKSPEQRCDFLKILREQKEQKSENSLTERAVKEGLRSLFSSISSSGFDSAQNWIASSNLNPEETQTFAASLNYYRTQADTGKWLDWLSKSPLGSASGVDQTTQHLVREWTEKDYTAAGQWLTQTPASPIKVNATIAYVSAVAPYDPEVASEWAATLPADRQKSAYQTIQANIKDPAAAAAYSEAHGLKN